MNMLDWYLNMFLKFFQYGREVLYYLDFLAVFKVDVFQMT